ncbi:related to mitochondrial inheritance component MDM10 [Cephalotrichum gorgonifer]|uniref:Mitochondrial distribution and morphology protein 10 n=1 Tax=Cephalotrichum gorgonifer TaxID=2041049 RepID=A0AAE8N142_9PEZI|nr:related to mitochondrial inheritance component MDM10 [Cephalotrichum gorgonifer]
MAYVQNAFYDATGWTQDNSYTSLNSTADDLLRFSTPQGLRLNLSSLTTPHFATSYNLGSVGVVDGSISYLYSSVALQNHFTPQSDTLPLRALCRGYNPLRRLSSRDPVAALRPEGGSGDGPSLLYGRLYLPQSLIEALVVKRFSPGLQFQLRAVSSNALRNGGSVLGLAQYDVGKYAVEGLASSDGGLLGLRGVYNLGGDANDPPAPAPAGGAAGSQAAAGTAGTNGGGSDREGIYGRFTAGGEIYYGTLNKSGGMSLALRFATLPSYSGTPLTATVTLNPLMGSVRASYAVAAGRHCSLATMLDFNVYSYESNWSVGMELWRKEFLTRLDEGAAVEPEMVLAPVAAAEADALSTIDPAVRRAWGRSTQAKLEWRLDPEGPAEAPAVTKAAAGEMIRAAVAAAAEDEEEYGGVIKARVGQNSRIGILWEGRMKALLYSIGTGIDLQRPDQPFRTLGLEIQYSS